MYPSEAESIEIDGLVKLARPEHAWWATAGEGLDALRFIAPEGRQTLPATLAAAMAVPPPPPPPPPQRLPSAPGAASEAPVGGAPAGSPPRAERREAPLPVSPPFRADASMHVLLEAWNAHPQKPQLSKLLQMERAVCVLVARSGRPLCDSVMGVIAAGPHMTGRTCAALHAAVQANVAGLPHLHELCRLRRFLGVKLEATSIGELELSMESLRADVSGMSARLGRLETSVSGLETSVSGLETSVSGLETSVSGLIERVNRLVQLLEPAAAALGAPSLPVPSPSP